MKSCVIYVENHKRSIAQARRCIESCKKFGYDITTLKGSTPQNMKIPFEYPEIKDGRVRIFKRENPKKYLAKKACFSNHIRIWKKVIEVGEPILVLEHDAIAIKEWDEPEYKEILTLNMQSAMSRSIAHAVKPPVAAYSKEGIQDIKTSGSKLIYNRQNHYKGSFMMPGTAAYVINPAGAIKLLKALVEDGWEQSDYFMNTYNVDIKYSVPDYFKLDINNLHLSHGL
jgi:GR25 family glycosyltransferase involved in LPS biosynthesis